MTQNTVNGDGHGHGSGKTRAPSDGQISRTEKATFRSFSRQPNYQVKLGVIFRAIGHSRESRDGRRGSKRIKDNSSFSLFALPMGEFGAVARNNKVLF